MQGSLRKRNRELSYDPAILLRDVFAKRTESRVSKRYLYTHVHNDIIHNSQTVEATQLSVDR